MAVFDRIDEKVALLAIVLATSTGVACGGGDGGGPTPVESNLELPSGEKGVIQLSGAVEAEVTAQAADLLQPRNRDETKLDFSGVNDACDNITFRVYFPITEGETGTFESIKTPQFTCKSTQYVPSSPVVVTLDTYSDGRVAGALRGTFDQKTSGGEKTSVDPPLEVEGKFDFEYGE